MLFFFNAQVDSSLMELFLGLGSLVQLYYIGDQFTPDIDIDITLFRIYIFGLFVNTIMTIFSALMLYGVNKKKANFMTPYIYFMFGMIGLAGLYINFDLFRQICPPDIFYHFIEIRGSEIF